MNRTSTIASTLIALFMLIPFACGGSGNSDGGHKGHKGSGPDLFLIANYATANIVIGQPDFETKITGIVNANSLFETYGNPLLYNGILYVPDYVNNRVLGFKQVPVVNGAAADFVIGQPDFTSSGASTAADGAKGPQTLKAYDGKLLATMYESNSVYIYNTIPIANGASADVIVGQDDFGFETFGCAANKLYHPESIFTVDGKLLVTDADNNRVLIWNSIPITNGAAADIVIGQPDLNTCNPAASPPTASTLNYPCDVWSDGTRLVVSDAGNNRILIWNTFPSSNGQPADVVLGQPYMTSNVSGASDRDMDWPYFLASNGTQLIVADTINSRVLIWNSIPTQNYTVADVVLGQPDFFFCYFQNENDGDCLTSGEGPGPNGMFRPSGLFLTSDMLMVMDRGNNRLLVFRE